MNGKSYELLIVLLMASLVLMGGQARNYKEYVGPYNVSFTLSDEMASNIGIGRNISNGAGIDSTPYEKYSLNLLPRKLLIRVTSAKLISFIIPIQYQ